MLPFLYSKTLLTLNRMQNCLSYQSEQNWQLAKYRTLQVQFQHVAIAVIACFKMIQWLLASWHLWLTLAVDLSQLAKFYLRKICIVSQRHPGLNPILDAFTTWPLSLSKTFRNEKKVVLILRYRRFAFEHFELILRGYFRYQLQTAFKFSGMG